MYQTYTVDEVIEAFCDFDGTYRRDYVDAALTKSAEIAPRLIELLERGRQDPRRYADDEDFAGHLYAAMLLGYFGEPRAHEVIVDLFRLPSRLVDDLFDDMITEDLPSILYRTCGGSLELIKALARDRKADVYCRNSALRAMTYAVADGVAPRAEVLEFFGTLFGKDEAPLDSSFWGLLATTANDLYPKELADVIRRAFDDDLIETYLIGYEDVEEALAGSPEAGLARIREEMQRHAPADFHELMSWWAMFEEEPRPVIKATKPIASTAPPFLSYLPSDQVTQKLTRQQRRKQERERAKAARKTQGRR
jgi:hypothetical protein